MWQGAGVHVCVWEGVCECVGGGWVCMCVCACMGGGGWVCMCVCVAGDGMKHVFFSIFAL